MNRKMILEESEKCICSKREADYGTPHDNFKIISNLWTVYLQKVAGLDTNITSQDVAIMMALLKIGRISSGVVKEDNYIDAAGYIALAGEIATSVELFIDG